MLDHAEAPTDTPNDAHMQLLHFLHERDINCPTCQYNLRNLTSDSCPECGEVIELRIGGTSGMRTWALVGVIGTALGLGFQVSLVLLILGLLVADGRHMPDTIMVYLLIGAGFIFFETALLIGWLYSHNRFARKSHQLVQSVSIILCLIAALLGIFSIVYLVNVP